MVFYLGVCLIFVWLIYVVELIDVYGFLINLIVYLIIGFFGVFFVFGIFILCICGLFVIEIVKMEEYCVVHFGIILWE